jgi:hypothetical protein
MAEENGREHGKFEIIIAILLGVAAVATAFAAYKGDLHDGDSIKAFNEGNRAVNDANQFYLQGNQVTAQDQALFLEYAKAARTEDNELVAYLRQSLMRDDLVKAIEWWEKDEKAQTPFDERNTDYVIPEYVEGEALTKKTNRLFATAKDEDETGDRYTLITVFLAAALFLYGIAAVAKDARVRTFAAAIGLGIFLVSLGMLITV